MIRRYQIDDSIFQALPQFFAIIARADRRRAFTQRRPIWNFFRTEMQIVWTSFNTDRKPLCPGGARLCKRMAC